MCKTLIIYSTPAASNGVGLDTGAHNRVRDRVDETGNLTLRQPDACTTSASDEPNARTHVFMFISPIPAGAADARKW